MSRPGGGRPRPAILSALGALHARGFHPAVIAGLVMMPAVVAVGFATDRMDRPNDGPPVAAIGLRGTLDTPPLPRTSPFDEPNGTPPRCRSCAGRPVIAP